MSGYKAYQGQQIQGAGPLGLVVLSYDALYKALGRARLSIEKNDLAQEADHTARAMEAIIELSSSLNFEAGEDISTSLASLYAYMMDRLAGSMCSGKTEHITEVMQLVEVLRDGWQQLAQQQSSQQAAVQAQPLAQNQAVDPASVSQKQTRQETSQQGYANMTTTASRLDGYAA
ncbi:MAG: flagellar export chaperone FliS [Mariprofundaceae bacterium]|nr:flagellar export chaperone FliS [Mariprofundaceae bacterium]